jgi:hypothetical protein
MGRESPQVSTIRAEADEFGEARWVRAGRLYWVPGIGPTPIQGDEYARREARLAERLRDAFGSSPYGPVTRDPGQAAEYLAAAMGTVVTQEIGSRPECSCADRRVLEGQAAEDYADFHLVFVALHPDGEASRFSCPSSNGDWLLTYPGPTPHGASKALLAPLAIRGGVHEGILSRDMPR